MHGLMLWSGGLWPNRLLCHLLGMGFLIAFPFPIKIFSYILYSFLLSLCFVWRLGGFLIRWIFLSGSDDVVGSVWVSAVAAPIPHSDYLKSDQGAKLPNYCHIWWHSPCHERANPHLSVIRKQRAVYQTDASWTTPWPEGEELNPLEFDAADSEYLVRLDTGIRCLSAEYLIKQSSFLY